MSTPTRLGDIATRFFGDGTYGSGFYGNLSVPVVPILISTLLSTPVVILTERSPQLTLQVTSTGLALLAVTPQLTVGLDGVAT